jgi:hypothetical protein
MKMAFTEFNASLSLYIPFVKKWQATEEYFANAFEYAFIGNVRSVDFTLRTDGAFSARVYIDWYENEFSYNWQKVIYAKNPCAPAHLYHTVGPNYWVLMENSPYNVEPIVQTNEVNTSQKGLVCFTQNDEECDYGCECDKCKLTYKIDELTRELSSASKKHEKDIERRQREITKLKDSVNSFDNCVDSRCDYESRRVKRNTEFHLEKCIKAHMLVNKEHIIFTLRRQMEIAILKEKRNTIGLINTYKTCMTDLEMVNKEYVQYKVRTHRKIKKLEDKIKATDVLPTSYEKCEINPRPLSIVSFKCNCCSIKVSFSAENEPTLSAKKHLCSSCYGRIYKNNGQSIRS